MPNMDPKKCPMPVQDPDVRNKNFKEVALGYTYEMAVNEAKRCLNCKNKPCVSGCPVNIDIPAFIAKVADEDMEGAYAVLSASSAVCLPPYRPMGSTWMAATEAMWVPFWALKSSR